jgi:hypothetical protein
MRRRIKDIKAAEANAFIDGWKKVEPYDAIMLKDLREGDLCELERGSDFGVKYRIPIQITYLQPVNENPYMPDIVSLYVYYVMFEEEQMSGFMCFTLDPKYPRPSDTRTPFFLVKRMG